MGRKARPSNSHSLLIGKDVLVVFQEGLDGISLEGDIREFTMDVHWTHDGRSENNSKIQGRHLKNC